MHNSKLVILLVIFNNFSIYSIDTSALKIDTCFDLSNSHQPTPRESYTPCLSSTSSATIRTPTPVHSKKKKELVLSEAFTPRSDAAPSIKTPDILPLAEAKPLTAGQVFMQKTRRKDTLDHDEVAIKPLATHEMLPKDTIDKAQKLYARLDELKTAISIYGRYRQVELFKSVELGTIRREISLGDNEKFEEYKKEIAKIDSEFDKMDRDTLHSINRYRKGN